jgi:hypothetical protein
MRRVFERAKGMTNAVVEERSIAGQEDGDVFCETNDEEKEKKVEDVK